MYISRNKTQIEKWNYQTNTDQPLSSIKEEIHNLNHLVHNTKDLRQYITNIEDFTIYKVKSTEIL